MPGAESKTKPPHELQVGEFFSYVGLFKIYQVQTRPELDWEFEGASLHCTCCRREYTPKPRFKFTVTDGGIRDQMGIRLRCNTVCTIHESFERAGRVRGAEKAYIVPEGPARITGATINDPGYEVEILTPVVQPGEQIRLEVRKKGAT